MVDKNCNFKVEHFEYQLQGEQALGDKKFVVQTRWLGTIYVL